MKLAIGVIVFVIIIGMIGMCFVVDIQRKEHERFMHFVWEAAYHENRSEVAADAAGVSVWATHYESDTGRQIRRIWIKVPGAQHPALISSQTINMWGYSQYGWESWSHVNDDVMDVIETYVLNLDSATVVYANNWMKYHDD